MNRLTSTTCALALLAGSAFAQTAPSPRMKATTAATQKTLVEFEMMTWVEVKAAMQAGKTTALVYTGGTEQRGPQNVNGGHNMMARETVRAIALKLGNAIAADSKYLSKLLHARPPRCVGRVSDVRALDQPHAHRHSHS